MNARRLVMATFAALCVLAGALTFGGASALAALPEMPETGTASAVTATTATLEGGVLNPNATAPVAPGEYEYLFSATGNNCAGEGNVAPEPPGIALGLPKEHVEPAVSLAGLQPNAKYTFCLIEYNAEGAGPTSTPGHFTTLPAPPTVYTEGASGATSTAATLEALVNPNNQVTTCERFQYGKTTAYGSEAPCETQNFGGYGGQRFSMPVSGLEAGTTYHFRVVVENSSREVTEGPDQSFTTVPTPSTDPAGAITTTTATFNGHLTLNPVDTQYFFEYKAGSECTEAGITTPGDAGSGPGGLASLSTAVTGLLPGTRYSVCLVAFNVFGSEQAPPVTFTTFAVAPTVSEESATKVVSSSARLQAEIDPGGAETTYHFDYGTSAAYGQSTPESPPVGADDSEHAAVADIQGLQPSTTYHYRVVARNSQSPGGVPGPDEIFTTQAVGNTFALPDGRAYELVSPPQKNGAEVLGIGGGSSLFRGGDPTQVSENGRSATYLTNAPIGENAPTSVLGEQIFSTRGSVGWSARDISVPTNNPPQVANGYEEYKAFSSDLSRAVLLPTVGTVNPPLAPEIHQEVSNKSNDAVGGGPNEVYLRNDLTNTFQAVVTSEPLPRVNFQGGSPDLSHIVFGGPGGLDPRHPGGGNQYSGALYEWSAGQIQLVDVLPDRQPASYGVLATAFFSGGSDKAEPLSSRHAVSDDGTRVLWGGEAGLFTRDMATEETQQVDAAQGGAGPSGGGSFVAASSDGTRVLFTDSNELAAAAREGGLFMFDVATGKLSDLTPAGSGIQMQMSFGANEEATSLYEVSTAVLTGVANGRGETAQAGASNLYLLRETPAGSGSWSTTFITDGAEGSGAQGAGEARPSPDGRYLAFMSAQSLTGYDNRDANSGEQDEEVYLYNADANSLICVSCDPTGARPVGVYDISQYGIIVRVQPMDIKGEWSGRWLAAAVPGFTLAGYDNISSGYQPRFLSDSGRLFFDSAGGLVPRDANGRDDVYEYEPVGVGSCQPPSYGQSASVVFDAAAGGCVGLISNGTRGADSVFFDASANGNDVFFTTADGLVSQDTDGVRDLYDARVCSQAEPCAPSPAVAQACTTTDSCRAAPAPEPGVFGSGPTETFTGAGNVTSAPAPTPGKTAKKTTRCAKGKRLSRGKCVKRRGKAKKAKRAGNKRRAKR